ncbi:zinc dependent phospholipase C family protein [Paracidobacterium acidisoli]|uniref:zinc dependent phospholipase C family protein n=1 Tax=Paracidobacterium acidisoli TaxID=2303751 RepID=UPI00131410EF|nr:zinc dependent phospholipase C family protein [Paracidobacterium acidisoli]
MGFAGIAVILLFVMFAARGAWAYSFLTHEAIIDLTWDAAIRPLLLERFPGTTEAQLREAHAYAYGGSAIQDAGYYPFGHTFFSELTHYVRTGDFISNMIHDARNVNELAFALGALSHYVGDTVGHSEATNPSTAIVFPNLEKQYGPEVTYEESPHAHIRTEFAFDIDELSSRRFAPASYLRHVGLRVSRRVLEEAFYQTYGLRLHDVLGNEFASFRSYRSSVENLLPRFAYAEVLLYRKRFPQDEPSPAFTEFTQRLKTADAENGWETFRKNKVSFRTRLLAVLIFLTPKFGPMSCLAIRGPNEQTEEKYIDSVNHSMDVYTKLLGGLGQKGQDGFQLANLDLDTGNKIRPGGYRLTDETYAKLLATITRDDVRVHVPAELRRNVREFYSNPDAPIETRKHPRQWKKVMRELATIEAPR